MEMALHSALLNGELHLQYQPVVSAGSGALRGFEALLRWEHPTLGRISPDKFIPIAEETRLIGAIGDWVVRTACAEAASWDGDVAVAVNVSPEQLHNPAFRRDRRQLAGAKRTAAAPAGAGSDRERVPARRDRGGAGAGADPRPRRAAQPRRIPGTGYSSLGY
ncbi:EAL domain-containing protein [Sphingomonas sp. MMS24-JH45]